MPVMDSPTIEQNLVRTIGNVITIGIGNKDKLWWHADVDPTHAYGDAGTESKVFGKSLFLVEDAVPIDVFENLYAIPLVRGMSPSSLIVIIFQSPEPTTKIKTKGDGFSDIRLCHEGLDLEARPDLHFGNGLVRF